jgi:hypothetical protein
MKGQHSTGGHSECGSGPGERPGTWVNQVERVFLSHREGEGWESKVDKGPVRGNGRRRTENEGK